MSSSQKTVPRNRLVRNAPSDRRGLSGSAHDLPFDASTNSGGVAFDAFNFLHSSDDVAASASLSESMKSLTGLSLIVAPTSEASAVTIATECDTSSQKRFRGTAFSARQYPDQRFPKADFQGTSRSTAAPNSSSIDRPSTS